MDGNALSFASYLLLLCICAEEVSEIKRKMMMIKRVYQNDNQENVGGTEGI